MSAPITKNKYGTFSQQMPQKGQRFRFEGEEQIYQYERMLHAWDKIKGEHYFCYFFPNKDIDPNDFLKLIRAKKAVPI